MAESKEIDLNPSSGLTSADPTSNPNLNSYHNLAIRPKEMNTSLPENESAEDDLKDEKVEASSSRLPDDDNQGDPDGLIIRKLAFARLAREICQDLQTDTRLSSTAIEALQEAAEAMLVSIFQDANLNAIKNERFTVNSKDMAVAQLVMKYGPDAAGEV